MAHINHGQMKPVLLVAVAAAALWGGPSPARASESDLEWKHTVGLVKQGQLDFAFAGFDLIAQTYPDSRYELPAEFARAEYYFLQAQYPTAVQKFEEFTQHHPRAEQAIVA